MRRGIQSVHPTSQIVIAVYKYVGSIPWGVFLPDDKALGEIDEALHIAELMGDREGLGLIRLTMGLALVHRDALADRERGLEVLQQVRDMCHRERFHLCELPVIDLYIAREQARCGDSDHAIPVMRVALDELFSRDQIPYCVCATAVLVETLLARGHKGDATEAQAAVDRLEAAPAGDGFAVREIMVVRLRALLSLAGGDEMAYREFADRYRILATDLGFEGHMKWAGAMA